MLALCDIVKMSDEDLAWFYPDQDSASAARQLVAGGIKLLCITEGSRGVTGYTAAHEVFVAARRAEVVDTVGAGDTFNAGLLASLHRDGCLTKDGIGHLDHTTIESALTFGATVAAVTVSRAGADAPWAHEL